MITRLFSRSALHEHAEPTQRLLGVAQLEPASSELRNLLLEDPAPEVRAAAAQRCSDPEALAQGLLGETDAAVRSAMTAALATLVAEMVDEPQAQALLEGGQVEDVLRCEVARRAQEPSRRRLAIAAVREEEALVDLALGAAQAEARLAAAERVNAPENLHKILDAAKQKDHGVYRVVRQRLDAIKQRAEQAAEADAVLSQLEALATRPGPILTEVVELNRRWQALDMSADTARLARCEAARRGVQERLEREQDEQRARMRFEAQCQEWLQKLRSMTELPDSATREALRLQLTDLRAEAERREDHTALEDLAQADSHLGRWEHEAAVIAAAEALVEEAERLAGGTYIDHGDLPDRWQALDRAIRTPALTRRFEAAMIAVEQRRVAHVQVAQQEASALRQRIHAALHTAEQALAAGQLREARAGADQIKKLRTGTGALPKPTMQRIGRLQQQLVELERWQAFGQHNARVQLCERAEAAANHSSDLRQLAQEIQALRGEWKALDQQYAGVPKSLWERFDRACEKAYAPAARHFAELAARRKEARKKREDFIALAGEHASTLLQEPQDWRAIERWLRETDQQWREGELGSVEPRAWKEFDARLKEALAPLRAALGEARNRAKLARKELIAQTTALAEKALDRDAPSQVKSIQSQWQEQAKALPLPQRDERALWEEFRSACDAVFKARHDKRNHEDEHKQQTRQSLERLCVELEQLGASKDKTDQEIRRALRSLQDLWKEAAGRPEPAMRNLEMRFRNARVAVEGLLASRARDRQTAVWQTLANKERLCEELDRRVQGRSENAEAGPEATAIEERWSALPSLPSAWEKKVVARRDAAVSALSDATVCEDHRRRMQDAAKLRREALLELEVLLSLDSPPEYQADRLALQVKQLRDRFKNAATTGPEQAGERLCDWCALPGVLETRDRERAERIFAAMGRRR